MIFTLANSVLPILFQYDFVGLSANKG